MATHSSILAGKIPWTEEPGGLHRVAKESDTTECLKLTQTKQLNVILRKLEPVAADAGVQMPNPCVSGRDTVQDTFKELS